MTIEIIKFVIYCAFIVIISKYILVKVLRKFAETLNFKAKTIGNVSGMATSVPELLTILASSSKGLGATSVYNILSSNVINFIQYIGTVILNKNIKEVQNKAIKIDLVLVVFTIIIPIVLIKLNINLNLTIVPAFIILYALFVFLNNNVHKLYLKKEDSEIAKDIEKERKWEKGNRKKMIKYVTYLFLTGMLLFVVGNELSNTLEKLCRMFAIPEYIIGILLGFITSIPELITFLEAQRHHKKEKDKMLGVVEATNNLLTSNILNLFIIQTIGIFFIY